MPSTHVSPSNMQITYRSWDKQTKFPSTLLSMYNALRTAEEQLAVEARTLLQSYHAAGEHVLYAKYWRGHLVVTNWPTYLK